MFYTESYIVIQNLTLLYRILHCYTESYIVIQCYTESYIVIQNLTLLAMENIIFSNEIVKHHGEKFEG